MTAGPLFLALIDEDDEPGPEHEVEDFEIFDAIVSHKEFEWALLELTIANPRIGLLAPGRKVWGLMLWRNPANPTADPEVLFKGRLISLPDNLEAETITLNFEARSSDFEAQKAALADTMRDEFWDPIHIDETQRDDPDSVLETRTEAWHIDRVTHEVTASDIVNGEDGTVTFDDSDILDLNMNFGDIPLSEATLDAEVFWTQKAMGIVDLNDELIKASRLAGGDAHLVSTYTGQGLANTWPKRGTNIGGDWSFDDVSIYPADFAVKEVVTETTVRGQSITDLEAVVVGFKLWRFITTYKVLYDTERQYKEKIRLTLRAGVQSVRTDPGGADKLTIPLGSGDVAAEIDPVGTHFEMPIGDVRRRAFFTTDRGRQWIENFGIPLLRATLIKRSRCAFVKVSVPFEQVIGLSCRMNATIVDDRIEGGTATGKIISYSFGIQDGQMFGEVTIACCIGTGDEVAAVPGTPVYAEEGVLDPDVQLYEGGTTLVAGSVTYGDYYVPPNDDGVNLFQMTPTNALRSLIFFDGVSVQKPVIKGSHRTPQQVADALDAVFSEVRLSLVPLNTGPFETSYEVPLSDLSIPRQIDLGGA